MKTNAIIAKQQVRNEYENAKLNAINNPFKPRFFTKFKKIAGLWRQIEHTNSLRPENKTFIFFVKDQVDKILDADLVR